MFCQQQVRSVQFGRHMDLQIQLFHRRKGTLRLGHRHRQIATHADECFCIAPLDGPNTLHAGTTMFARNTDRKIRLKALQEIFGRRFVDPHRTIALHVRVTAQRADPRPRLTYISFQQQQVYQLLNVLSAVFMLGDAQAVTNNRSAGFTVAVRQIFHLTARQTRVLFQLRPATLA